MLTQTVLQRVDGTVPSWQGGRRDDGKDAHDLTMLDLGRGEEHFAKFGIGGPLAGVQHRGRLTRQDETVL